MTTEQLTQLATADTARAKSPLGYDDLTNLYLAIRADVLAGNDFRAGRTERRHTNVPNQYPLSLVLVAIC